MIGVFVALLGSFSGFSQIFITCPAFAGDSRHRFTQIFDIHKFSDITLRCSYWFIQPFYLQIFGCSAAMPTADPDKVGTSLRSAAD